MAEVTAPLLLDGTGQSMLTKLEGIRAALAAEVTVATTAVAGIVKPDGTSISVTSDGTISSAVAPATTAVAGVVKPDGTSINVAADGTISSAVEVAPATTAVAGIVKPDGTTISVASDGAISSIAPTSVSMTLAASGWSSGIYSFEAQYPNTDYDILGIYPNESTTDAQRKAWIAADCGGYRTTNTIQSHGTVPTIDLVLTVIVKHK